VNSVKTLDFCSTNGEGIMDESIEYDIVWDEEEAEFLNELAFVILKDKYTL
jgi:hypothetical protein